MNHISYAQTSLYVDSLFGNDANIGNTWGASYKTLSKALETAHLNPLVEKVFVAKGTYYPNRKPFNMGANKIGLEQVIGDPRSRTFHVRSGLELYGGYPNSGGSQNSAANPTKLSGRFPNGDSVFHVVFMDSVNHWAAINDTAVIDGFVITGGCAMGTGNDVINGQIVSNRFGGGIFIYAGVNLLRNNTIEYNDAYTTGAGFFTSNSTNIIVNNHIHKNAYGTTINNATVHGAGGYTGGGRNFIYENLIDSNTASQAGGIYCYLVTTGDYRNNTFLGNGAGGLRLINCPNSTIKNNQFIKNEAITLGGGLTIRRSVMPPDTANVQYNLFFDNTTGDEGGGAHFYATSILNLTNNLFIENGSGQHGGGVYDFAHLRLITNNTFYHNYAYTGGGGLYSFGQFAASGTRISNNLFWKNQRAVNLNYSHGQDIRFSSPNNSGPGSVPFYNNILQHDSNNYTTVFKNYLGDSASNNYFNSAPDFVDTANYKGVDGIWGTSDDGLRLKINSIGINAGYNTAVNDTLDYIGAQRIQGGTVDIGAYEGGVCFPTFTTANQSICSGNNFLFNGQSLTMAGTYTDTIQSINNCDSIATLNLIVNSVDSTVSVAGITLTANENGASYQWLDCGNSNTPITGATAQNYTPAANGSYAVSVTKNNCNKTSICHSVLTIGIAKNSFGNNFRIYPNPAETFLVLEAEKSKHKSIEVYNAFGQVIYKKESSEKKTYISTENYSTGLYFIKVQIGNKQHSQSILIK